MSAIPPDKVTEKDLADWWQLADHLSTVKQSEHFARLRIFRGFFPSPKEGANTHILSDGYQLKATHVLNYSVEIATVNASLEALGAAGIVPADLIKWTPELKISEYRKLTKEQKEVFDQCITIKDGSPQLDIVPPKADKKVGETAPAAPGEETFSLTAPPAAPADAKPPAKKKKAAAKKKKA